MKKYVIGYIREKNVCTPSDDYYARGNDWSRDYVNNIELIYPVVDTMDECVERIESDLEKGEYLILPVYVKE